MNKLDLAQPSQGDSATLDRPSAYLPGFEPPVWHQTPVIRVLSLGAGVQSTAIALMAESGMFGVRPDAAIFADTKAEPAHVYANIRWIAKRVSFPVYVVDNGRSLHQDAFDGVNQNGTPHVVIPVFVKTLGAKGGMLIRQCTSKYKVEVIRQKVAALLRERLGSNRKPPASVEQWLGISTDEATRMRDSDLRYIYHYYPLIESVGYSRQDCARWLRRNYPQHEVKKSACVFCPFHDDATWARMKAEQPEDFAVAVALDERLRDPEYPGRSTVGYSRYLHRSLTPLSAVDFGGDPDEVNMWENDCQGHCGV